MQLPFLILMLENPEWLIIGLIVVVLFGTGRLSTLGRDLGTGIREFKRATRIDDAARPSLATGVALLPPSTIVPVASPRTSMATRDYLPGVASPPRQGHGSTEPVRAVARPSNATPSDRHTTSHTATVTHGEWE